MAVSNGNCFICGKTAGKTAIKNHILKEHDGDGEDCWLFKAEGAYNKDYWLFFTVPINAAFSAVDDFLRDIWCECCGHLSAFSIGRNEFDMSEKLSSLCEGDVILYEYDFGSTTEIILTVVDEISRTKQREKVRLLARNAPLRIECDRCGAPAVCADVMKYDNLCAECAKKVDDDGMLLPVTNSPRFGECDYEGNYDIWTFDPDKPFPQPQKPTRTLPKRY
ncbi:MAG: hypothetical protein LBI38_01075 [Oscillospiraceae bacterium]|jgi:hypothetical protein|nr:hypothetical protein [Oscillospiraceae bacterium]